MPSDPSDDTELSFELVKDTTGRTDDFCEVAVPALSSGKPGWAGHVVLQRVSAKTWAGKFRNSCDPLLDSSPLGGAPFGASPPQSRRFGLAALERSPLPGSQALRGRRPSIYASRERLARNQALYREVDKRIHDIADGESTTEFVCECSNTYCAEFIALTNAEYERIRSNSTWFVVKPDHDTPQLERVLSRDDGFAVVEKLIAEDHPEVTDFLGDGSRHATRRCVTRAYSAS